MRKGILLSSTVFVLFSMNDFVDKAEANVAALASASATASGSASSGRADRRERELLRQANERKSGGPNYSANVGSGELERRYTENGYKTIYVMEYDESGMPVQPDPTIYEQCENDNTVAFLRRDWNVSYSDAYHRIVCI